MYYELVLELEDEEPLIAIAEKLGEFAEKRQAMLEMQVDE